MGFRFALVVDLGVETVFVGGVCDHLVTAVRQQNAVLSGYTFAVAVGFVFEVRVGGRVLYLVGEVERFGL